MVDQKALKSRLRIPAFVHAWYSLIGATFYGLHAQRFTPDNTWDWLQVWVWGGVGLLGLWVMSWPRWVRTGRQEMLDVEECSARPSGVMRRWMVFWGFVLGTCVQLWTSAWTLYVRAIISITSAHRDYDPSVPAEGVWVIYFGRCWPKLIVVVLALLGLGHAVLVRRAIVQGARRS